MANLKQQKCDACTGDSPAVTEEEINKFQQEIPQWDVKEENGEKRLERVFKFSDFKSALNFTNKIGEEAENQEHHPALLTEYGKVTVMWWTHAIQGLHRNDFIMAAKTDEIFNKSH
ncbi:4a-hydroxytetrahydrobiopterin dehydratase [Rivularia sp. UHCC 0363]|uniref:4a-hydroxytetrahydrobiopterin dehydratase n=1 Tax=Rivularia sp. UHCC 0363 TaxID=3110244 RepID=UPI002B20968F|nr:4a-hydroxytetrahydrobiopterin dehydratase [Rivularia sp. UHCC 0363]MEA5594662.1 4a-hydroxytetrahydrobiopterin dehydratase [Rivularia sp. UHCC 0363]